MSDRTRRTASEPTGRRFGGEPLLRVTDLEKHYPITEGILKNEVGRVRAVDGISFDVYPGETVGIVGESGCGKSTAATSLLRLEEPTGGEIVFDGENIRDYDKGELREFRRRAQMIFQDPTSSFDPRMSVGTAVAEPLLLHGIEDRATRRRVVENLLERVGLEASDYDRYPHELSGGQKQRVALARAMVVNPELIVADEPTSALDVSIQSEILSLIDDIQEEFGLSIVFISHNLGVIREICDRVAVMYLGEIVELGSAADIFDDPQHPYTEALLQSIPRPDPRRRGRRAQLTGDVPDPANPPSGCRFHTRCPKVIQPDGLDMDQQNYRRVMDMRESLAKGNLSVPELTELAAAEYDVSSEAAVSTADLERAARDEVDLPASFDDPAVDDTVERAIAQIAEGDQAAAVDTLAETFESRCERSPPESVTVDGDHTAACYLVDGQSTTGAESFEPSTTD
jgi:peptide/nickel transport system ATP-binding protein